MKMDTRFSQISSANAGIAYFFPNKADGSPLAAAVEKLKTQRQLSQILATFEQEKDLPTYAFDFLDLFKWCTLGRRATRTAADQRIITR